MNNRKALRLEVVIFLGKASPAALQRSALADFAQEILPARDIDSALELLGQTKPDLVIVEETVPPEQTLSFLNRTRLCAADYLCAK